MKKPLNKIDRPDLKHLFSEDVTSQRVISKAGVQKEKSLTSLDAKEFDSPASQRSKERSSSAKRSSNTLNSVKNRDTTEVGFLGSRNNDRRAASGFSTHVRVHIVLLLLGLVGSIACLWAMIYTSRGEEVATNLGLQRVANSLETILAVLAYPVLLFTLILTAYSIQQLYLAYRRANFLDSNGRSGKR